MNATTPWCSSCKKEPSRRVAKGGFNFHLRWETPPVQSTSPMHQILTISTSRATCFFALLNSPYFMILILMCHAYANSITLHPMTILENNHILCGECHPTLRATSHTRLRARDHHTSSTLIGGKGGASPSSLHTMLEGPTEYVNARWM